MGLPAEYVGAGAAASAYVLGLAIQQYYSTRVHAPGVFDTDGIIAQLKKTRLQTFFGDVEFNSYRRNVAKEPATTQIIPDRALSYGVDEKCVLPGIMCLLLLAQLFCHLFTLRSFFIFIVAFGNYELVKNIL
jgi:hypothetical protein